nr:MAG TPA: chitin synthase regulator [Inoviridae sp.]
MREEVRAERRYLLFNCCICVVILLYICCKYVV